MILMSTANSQLCCPGPGDNISGTASTTPSWAQRNYPAEFGNIFHIFWLYMLFVLQKQTQADTQSQLPVVCGASGLD